MAPFTGHALEQGSGFGSLALGVGRVAFLFPKKVLLPAVQSNGEKFFIQSLPPMMEVVTKKNSFKRAAKHALRKIVRKQKGMRRKNRNIQRKRKLQSRRSDFFSKVREDYTS